MTLMGVFYTALYWVVALRLGCKVYLSVLELIIFTPVQSLALHIMR